MSEREKQGEISWEKAMENAEQVLKVLSESLNSKELFQNEKTLSMLLLIMRICHLKTNALTQSSMMALLLMELVFSAITVHFSA